MILLWCMSAMRPFRWQLRVCGVSVCVCEFGGALGREQQI